MARYRVFIERTERYSHQVSVDADSKAEAERKAVGKMMPLTDDLVRKVLPKPATTLKQVSAAGEKFPAYVAKDASGATVGYAVVGTGEGSGPNGKIVLHILFDDLLPDIFLDVHGDIGIVQALEVQVDGDVVIDNLEFVREHRQRRSFRCGWRRIQRDRHNIVLIVNNGVHLQEGYFFCAGGAFKTREDHEQGCDEPQLGKDQPLVLEAGLFSFLDFHGALF
jgi:hypothetical protein